MELENKSSRASEITYSVLKKILINLLLCIVVDAVHSAYNSSSMSFKAILVWTALFTVMDFMWYLLMKVLAKYSN